MRWDFLLAQVADRLEQHSALTPGASWVVGVSGGPDSTLLLHAMVELARQRGYAWPLHVAHLHHGLRGADADEDASFVRRLSEKLGLTFHEERADPRAGREGASIGEELLRQKRYDFLERVALRTGSELVAVAHHADDNAETVLHRICRGTGLRGLSGMRGVRPIRPGSHIRLVRPLLGIRRATIEALVAERAIDSRTDATNLDTQYTRGRIRNLILPTLREQLNPNTTEAILRLAEQAGWLGDYLENAAARTFQSLVVSEGPRHVVLNARALLGKQRIIQAEVVRLAMAMVADGDHDLSFAHIDAALHLAEDSVSGKELHLPGAVCVTKRYDRLEFRPLSAVAEPPELVPAFVACPGRTALPLLRADLVVEVCPVAARKADELRKQRRPLEVWVDYDRVRLPLLVRGRRDGDRFWPLGAPGSKSVGDFLSDEKVEPDLRARTGVLCDQLGPIWVMPLRIDDRVKLRQATQRALRLSLEPMNHQSHSGPAAP